MRRGRVSRLTIPDEELDVRTPTPLSPVNSIPVPSVPNVMNSPTGKPVTQTTSLEGLTPHKDHYHVNATGQKVAGPGLTTENLGEKLYPHKDHYHTEQTANDPTIKVLGPGTLNEDTGKLEYGHKDHSHDTKGAKIPGSTNPDLSDAATALDGVPGEEDVINASLEEQRRQIRKRGGRGRLSTIMHGRAGNTLG